MPRELPVRSSPRLSWSQLRAGSKVCVILFCTLAFLGTAEVGARVYWLLTKKVPLLHSERIWHTFYPEVEESGVEQQRITRDDETFDVLLLGGSVLYPRFGNVAELVHAGLEAKLHRPVRIYNLSNLGMSSLDSRLKYERLAGQRFDLVIAYEGINDVYMNNCAAGFYRDDYAHVPRYQQIYLANRHKELPYLAFPYTGRYLMSRTLDRLSLSTRPRREWHYHGLVIKTPPGFAANLEAIAAIAEERGDPLVLMSYAYHLDPRYTLADFQARKLDYGKHASPIELWGTPENVVRTLDAHNVATRRVAGEHPAVTFIDQQKLMPTGAANFNDICHLTEKGCQRFVDNILKHIH